MSKNKIIIKILLTIGAIAILPILFMIVGLKENFYKEPNNTMLVNPLKEFNTLEELENNVGFKLKTINDISEEYSIESYVSISDEIAQLMYKSDNNKISYRMAKINKDTDISGTYGPYQKEYQEDGITYRCIENEELVNVIIWSDGEYDYSCSLEKGMPKEDTLKIKKNIK